jgi:hypothetical protein
MSKIFKALSDPTRRLGTRAVARRPVVPEFQQRSNGVLMGVIVVMFANVIPKQISSALRLTLNRVAGRALVLGGAGYALSWLLPLTYAHHAALLILLFAVTYAAAYIVRSVFKHPSTPPGPSQNGH